MKQLIPDEIKYDANATPPQFTNNADMVIEPSTHLRVKIIGLRTEVGEMWAIGSINGDFLGYVGFPYSAGIEMLTHLVGVFRPSSPGRNIVLSMEC